MYWLNSIRPGWNARFFMASRSTANRWERFPEDSGISPCGLAHDNDLKPSSRHTRRVIFRWIQRLIWTLQLVCNCTKHPFMVELMQYFTSTRADSNEC